MSIITLGLMKQTFGFLGPWPLHLLVKLGYITVPWIPVAVVSPDVVGVDQQCKLNIKNQPPKQKVSCLENDLRSCPIFHCCVQVWSAVVVCGGQTKMFCEMFVCLCFVRNVVYSLVDPVVVEVMCGCFSLVWACLCSQSVGFVRRLLRKSSSENLSMGKAFHSPTRKTTLKETIRSPCRARENFARYMVVEGWVRCSLRR